MKLGNTKDGITNQSNNIPMKNRTNTFEIPCAKLFDQKNQQELFKNLLHMEINECAIKLKIDSVELQDWINLQVEVPIKTILLLLRSAKQYQLNPLEEEIILIEQTNVWQSTISINGWIKIINQHPAFSGVSFLESNTQENGVPTWMECTIYRSDRAIGTTIREYFLEVQKESEIWQKMPRRMLRHKALQQCARLTFGVCEPYLNANSKLDASNGTRSLPHQRRKQNHSVGLGADALRKQLIMTSTP